MSKRPRGLGGAFLWGFACPRCGGDTDVFVDERSATYGWICPESDCTAVGFGFESRRAARVGLRAYLDDGPDGRGAGV
ncbi:hypothetical protein NDI76_09555 [Halogeometricum sp. S1BR25-6]|uniref:Small CPxCG-related zinc finger protein n=1 Tax=Halogeometricum salsisoli TaxID=2950536 RepID=A0ABU2GDV2_9EURY|nr:hypothetical protein [Halogeometricum sp. S1BR25-6]MDS0298991.1 hypothetical protein [Halogeometricum sp. S1BR25-6]